MQNQFNSAQAQLHNELNATRNKLQATQASMQAIQSSSIKPKKPDSFSGKTSDRSWIIHFNNYTGSKQNPQAMNVAANYLQGPAHEWWIRYDETEESEQVIIWRGLQEALIGLFEMLKKIKIARNKLAKWKKIKDASSFIDDFQKILIDIPTITVEEQLDRYARGLKTYIWKETCTK